MSLDVEQVQSVFLAAVEINDPSQRSTMLDRRCGDDAELRKRVEALLRAHDEPDNLPPVLLGLGAPTDELPSAYSPDMLIAGRYKLLEEIAEGGMGTVWVAEQIEPVRRRVALKLIKPGMDSRQVLSRFEAERQALALMDHPNIAKVFDGGLTSHGRPFFAMEYVKGAPITSYCDANRLSLRERLELFVQVCHGVQHAHHKGIIHRDLKPSNILVCQYDGQPVPKVIDFGLAKAMHQPLTQQTLYTAHCLMVGTPRYMSPEQAEINNHDVDTRTDVYSLGVILYELLTGATPLEGNRFNDAAWQEVLRLIKEEEPTKPSSKLNSCGTLIDIAAQRGLEPAQLCRAVRGDLDWIVMKALEKERSRRYTTASDLARDVERHLLDEPVEARPPSASYRLRKFARRNRVAITTATLVSAALLAGTVVSTTQAIRAARAEREATRQRKIAEGQRNEAEKRRVQAEANFQKAHRAVYDYFRSVSGSKQLNVSALQPLRKELLDSAITYYRQFIEQYQDDSAVQPQLAEAYVAVGRLIGRAIGSQERALTALDKGTEVYERLTRENPTVETYQVGLADACHELGNVQRFAGRLAEAVVSHQRGLEIYENLATRNPLNRQFRDGLARARIDLGTTQNAMGQPAEAEASLRSGLEIYETLAGEAPEDNAYLSGISGASYQLGHLQRMMGRLADAQASYQRRLKIVEQLARENPAEADYSMGIAGASHYLGRVQHMSGRLAAAETSHRRALEIYQELIHQDPGSGSYRIGAARTYYHLGLLQSITGRRDEAAQSWTTAATTYVAAGDLGYPRLQVFSGLGGALAMLGKWQEAGDAFAKGVDGSEPDWPSLFQLALLRWAVDDEAGYRLACTHLVSRYGDNADGAQAAAIAMACIAGLNAVDETDAVLAIIQRAAASNPKNPVYQTLVGAAQFRAGQTHEAIQTLTGSLPMQSAAESAEPMQLEQMSRLTGETILALAYHELKDEQALEKQLDLLRDLVGKLEVTTPQYSEELGQWALSLTIHCAKRDLVRLEADALK